MVSINSDWMDGMMIENPKKVKELILSNPNVKAISSGHVHQEFTDQLGHAEVFTTPSTCYQFFGNTETRLCMEILVKNKRRIYSHRLAIFVW